MSLQDYYSRYIEAERLYSTRASFIIMKMKGILARHGIPEQVFSDNGPQFSCTEFAQFANTWGFVHSTSSPQYPQSNGLTEKAVQTGKDNHNDGDSIASRPLHCSSGVPYDAYFGLRKVTCTSVDEKTFEFHSTLDTGLAITGPCEPRGYSTALRRESRETEDVLRQKTQNSCRYLSRRPRTAEKEHGRLPECGRHRESRHTTVVHCSYEGRCSLQMHQSTSQETETLWW